jgi:hypothetical protein
MRLLMIAFTTLILIASQGCGDSSNPEGGVQATSNAEKQSADASAAPQRNGIVGRWLDDVSNPLFASTLTILVEDGRYYLETKYNDGSARKTGLVEKESSKGRRFDIDPKANPFRMKDYWIIDKNGDLLLENELNPGTGLKAHPVE